jgi:hypothetical protein
MNLRCASQLKSALFAGVLITLAQLIPAVDGGTSREVLRFFVSCSIVVNLTSSGLASCNSVIFSGLPRRAAMLILLDPDSLPYKVAVVNQPLTSEIMSDRMRLLTKFGLKRLFLSTNYWGTLAFLFGNVLAFTSLVIWIWTEQSRVVAGTSMIFVVPCAISLFYALSRLLLIGNA